MTKQNAARLVAFAAVLAAVWIMRDQLVRSMLYPAPPVVVPDRPPSGLEVVEGSTGPWMGWFRPPPPDGPVVLLLHGNGENLATVAASGLFERFAVLGAGVLVIDYPGYGSVRGRPSESTLVAAASDAWRWVERENTAAPRRILVGWSLGAAVAAQVAGPGGAEPDALILLSPWSSLEAVASAHFPSWLVRVALRDRYESEAVARELTVPTLVVHGGRDGIIPASQGRAVHAALGGPKRWLELSDAGHNDLLGFESTWRAIASVVQGAEPFDS